MALFSVVGVLTTDDYRYTSCSYSGQGSASYYSGQSVQTSSYSCYTGSTNTFCTINYRPDFWGSYSTIPCYAGTTSTYCSVTLPSSYSYTGTCSAYSSVGTSNSLSHWLFFAVGHTAISAPLNIAWGALTLGILGVLMLSTASQSPRATEATSLLYQQQQQQQQRQQTYQQQQPTYQQPTYSAAPDSEALTYMGADKSEGASS